MALDSIYRRSTDVVSRRVLDDVLVVPIRGELADLQRIFAMNRVAQHIWEQLDGERDLQAVCDSIVATFEVDPAQAQDDLDELIAQLIGAGLIVEVPLP